jgi:anion-transporting  ArsA/GET3 family ATPase
MVDHIRRLARQRRYRHIVWDTAPLGQTLALLETPEMLARHLPLAPRVYSHLKASGEGREPVKQVLHRSSRFHSFPTRFAASSGSGRSRPCCIHRPGVEKGQGAGELTLPGAVAKW